MSEKQGRFVLTDTSLSSDNDGRPTGEGMASTVSLGNIEVENTAAGDVLVRTKPWSFPTTRMDFQMVVYGLHAGQAMLGGSGVVPAGRPEVGPVGRDNDDGPRGLRVPDMHEELMPVIDNVLGHKPVEELPMFDTRPAFALVIVPRRRWSPRSEAKI